MQDLALSKNRRFFLIAVEIFMIASLAGIFIYIFATTLMDREPNDLDAGECIEITEGYERVYPDGTRESITLPYSANEPAETVVTMEYRIPDTVSDNDWLFIRSIKQDISVYIDGELKKTFIQGNQSPFRQDLINRNIFVDIDAGDRGKIVRTESVRHIDGERYFETAFTGTKYDYLLEVVIGEDSLPFFFIFVYFVLGFLCVIFGIYARIVSKGKVQVDYMGWATLFIGVWDATQSQFREFIFSNVKGISILPAVSLMIYPIAMALYFNKIQKNRYVSLYMGSIALDLTIVFTRLLLQILHVRDFYQGVYFAFVEIAVLFLVFIYTVRRDRKIGAVKEYSMVVYGIYGMAFLGVIQIYNFIVSPTGADGIYLCIGFGIVTMMSVINALQTIIRMERETKAAVMASDIKSQFLANMSHEIRTPINAVLGLNEAILRETDQDVVRKYAADVDNAGQLLLSLINDILDFSKLEAGKMSIVPVNYNIKEVITSCCQMISEKVEKKGLKLELAIDENLPSVLNGDEVRVRQIIMNLMSNAVKYTQKGKIKLTVREMAKNEKKTFIRDDTGGMAMLYISVSDTGQGIKPSDREHLFESFTRIDELKNKNIEGTGLGLAITKHLVQLMYGEIDVTSTYGVGSCFIVKLPQEIVDTAPIGQVSVLEGSEKRISIGFDDIFKAPGARLLVVDDVPSNLVVVTSLLKYTQMDIDTASSGDEAIELCRKKAYHVILLDHMMPGRDGIETLKILRKDRDGQNHRTPVIMLSANAMAGAGEKYMMEGFDDYLSKPITAKRLEEKLLKFIPPHMIKHPTSEGGGAAIPAEQAEGAEALSEQAGPATSGSMPANEASPDKLPEDGNAAGAQEGTAPLIDIPSAMKYCGDDMEILRAVAGAFLEDDRRTELKDVLEKGDMEAYSIVIHGIKSASKSIGAETVSEEARKLEMLAKDGDVEGVRAGHDDFIRLYEQLFEEIKNL